MREQFEAWVLSKSSNAVIDTILDKDKNGKYFHGSIEGVWQAWQASRACLGVELPKEGRDGLVDWNAVVEKLEAQGIKVRA